MGYTSAVRKCIHKEIRKKFSLNLIHEKNGLEKPYLLFAEDMVYPERHIISGRTDTSRKE
jgi:hypothetical protein